MYVINDKDRYIRFILSETDEYSSCRNVRRVFSRYLTAEGVQPAIENPLQSLKGVLKNSQLMLTLRDWSYFLPLKKEKSMDSQNDLYIAKRKMIEKDILPVLKEWVLKKSIDASNKNIRYYGIFRIKVTTVTKPDGKKYLAREKPKRVNDKAYLLEDAEALVKQLNERSSHNYMLKRLHPHELFSIQTED